MPEIQANGLTLHYDSRGNETDPVILLIMGLGVQMVLWPDELIEMLVSKGFRVVRLDNRDVGLSTKLDHLGVPNVPLETIKYMLGLPVKSPYLIDDMAADTMGFIDALGLGRVHLVGASMGGMIAQNVAARWPERVVSLTSIMSTTGRRNLPQPTWRAKRALLQKPARKGDTEGAIHRMVNVMQHICSRTYPPNDARLREACTRHVMRSHHPAGGTRQLMAIIASGDRTNVIRQIKAPSLILHGEEDPLVPIAAGLDTAKAIRDGGGTVEVKIIKGMGHDLPVPLLPTLADAISEHCRKNM